MFQKDVILKKKEEETMDRSVPKQHPKSHVSPRATPGAGAATPATPPGSLHKRSGTPPQS